MDSHPAKAWHPPPAGVSDPAHLRNQFTLAAGANPAYIARQMGHKNAKMFFTVYAKWINGADRGREKAKIEALIGKEKPGSRPGNLP